MFTAFDVGVAVLVLISAILATARGFTREVLSLATWAGSAGIAAYMYFYHKDIARGYIQGELIADGVTVLASFVVALIVLHLITMWIADVVVDSKVGPLDRTLGFLFGVARGVLIAVVFVVFGGNLLNLQSQSWAAESRSWPVLADFGNSLIAVLPDDVESQLTNFLQRGGKPVGEVPASEVGTDAPEDSSPLPPPADGTTTPAPADGPAPVPATNT